jgi:hypothetical protein
MKQINNYIVEKLHLSKDIRLDQYKVGDRCLMAYIVNWKSSIFTKNDKPICLLLDVLKIKELDIDNRKISYQYITPFFHRTDTDVNGDEKFNIEKNDKKQYIYFTVLNDDVLIEILIPHQLSLFVMSEIEDKKEFNLFDYLKFYPKRFEEIEKTDIPISFNSEKIDYDEAKIKKLKEVLNEKD